MSRYFVRPLCSSKYNGDLYRHSYLKTPLALCYPYNEEDRLTSFKIQSEIFPKEIAIGLERYDEENNTILDTENNIFLLRYSWNTNHHAQKYQYVYPYPEFLTGLRLFKHDSQLKLNSQKYWNKLSHQEKVRYDDVKLSHRSFAERFRIWKGYEIVEYLKRNSDEHRYNPYPFSGLYPWEIIRDKLHNKKKVFAFEVDIYDNIIEEALSIRYCKRSPFSIFSLNMQKPSNEKNLGIKARRKLYERLSHESKEIYEAEVKRRENHISHLKDDSYKSASPFSMFLRTFYKEELDSISTSSTENYTLNEQKILANKRVASKWKNLSMEERSRYSSMQLSSNTRLYKEMLLDRKTDLVMSYIFDVCKVKGLPSSFDWKIDKEAKTKGLKYIYKFYVQKLPYVDRGSIVFG